MFDSLADRLQDVFRQIRGEGRLTEETVEVALREIRMALLEADVNFKVVKAFIDRVRDRAVDQEVLRSLTPDQQVVRIVRDEMLALFGDAQGGLPTSAERPRVIMLLGLQGSGKTTTSAKLGRWLTKQGRHPLLVSTDVRRPAAIEQLSVVGKQAGVRVHDPAGQLDPVARATGALTEARNSGFDVVIVDTAGRLHIDDRVDGRAAGDQERGRAGRSALRRRRDDRAGRDQERRRVQPADRRHRRRAVEDGRRCARRRRALGRVGRRRADRVRRAAASGSQDLEPFHADRVVSRVLGMGDVLSLIEKAEEAVIDRGCGEARSRRCGSTTSRSRISRSAPHDSQDGAARADSRDDSRAWAAMKELKQQREQIDEKQLLRVEAIINSMTPKERRNHQLINGSRRKRIAQGQRDERGRSQPPAEAVHPDEEDAQDGDAAAMAAAGEKKRAPAAMMHERR